MTRALMALALLLLDLGMSGSAPAQVRGGPPMGLPPGLPGRIGPADLPGGAIGHGPPPWAVERIGGAAEAGASQARAVVAEKLSRPELQRAMSLQKADPALYELDRGGALVMRGEVLASGLDGAALDRLAKAGFTLLRREDLPDLDLHLAVISRDRTGVEDLIKLLRKTEPKGIYAPNHVLFGSSSPVRKSGSVPASPDISTRAIRIGLVDTAVAPRLQSPSHLHLIQKAFQPGGDRPGLHGTAVASLLAERPGPVTLYSAAIFSETRGGSSDLLVSALGWLAAARVPVINVSMVGPANPIVALVVAALVRKGFTVVAPVGNDGAAARPLYPASYPGVIAVSAASADGRLLPEASRVPHVDFVAPGIARTPDPMGGETIVRGTSFAAPVVSRLLAERIVDPEAGAARAGIAALARSARQSAGGRRWHGPGLLVGE